VGHHFWHYLDPTHPAHEPNPPAGFADAIATIYARLDDALGRLIEAAGADATVLVVASHGMGRTAAGWQLLPEVLVRLGLSSDGGTAGGSAVRRLQNALRDRVRRRWVRVLQEVADTRLARAVQSRMGGMVFPLQSSRTRATILPNNRVGAIRLNVQGREPYGCVAPGAEAAALLEELRRELLALEDPASGERIVARVETADEAFGPSHHPDVPDLLVIFRTDLGPLEACRSARVGTVRAPSRNARIPRTGDHTSESRLWAVGPGIRRGAQVGGGSTLSIAPTILQLLGVERPGWLDAEPLALRADPRR
jgi:predicted AlkP superfamily phosphohydrolase/phosphomutase